MSRCYGIAFALLLGSLAYGDSPTGSRLAYLDEREPFYPNRTLAKLTTPMWVGEKDVDAVVFLSIDDMADPERYEAYLRPLLDRLREIEGRAPVSIFTCRAQPQHPRLQQFLGEGLSLEIHTQSHPCPLFRLPAGYKSGDSLTAIYADVFDCLTNVKSIAGAQPVCFRTPCCDSLNTTSPRLFTEILGRSSRAGARLTIDSSTFNLPTPADPEVKREWVYDADGNERFRKYIPFRNFALYLENYPYPYVIDKRIWETPAVIPTDWAAQHLHRPDNPKTVEDWKRALDIVIAKKGLFNLVFHPHNWIRPQQLVEFVDYAHKTYGRRIRFLNIADIQKRLDQHLLAGQPLQTPTGGDNGVRVLDVDGDGYMDVIVANAAGLKTRLWRPTSATWNEFEFPVDLTAAKNVRFYTQRNGQSAFFVPGVPNRAFLFTGTGWRKAIAPPVQAMTDVKHQGGDDGVRFRDVDGDGADDCLINNASANYVWLADPAQHWRPAPFALPKPAMLVDAKGADNGLRFVDLDGDGHHDLVHSNESTFGIWLYANDQTGWSNKVVTGRAEESTAIPPIARFGRPNGAWFHGKALYVANEFTATKPDLVEKRTFDNLLKFAILGPRSPAASTRSIQTRPGFTVELVAAEPMTMDPVFVSFGPDGKAWVAEMADYPLGVDGKGKPGGRVRFLEDVDGDGKFERSSLFLDNIPFPNSVIAWRKGVLITAAPDLLYAEDTDGDGKADVKKVVLSGFNPGNQQHRVNGFVWGLDNWLHLCNGDSGGSVRSDKMPTPLAIGGRDLRIRPDEQLAETEAGQSQFGKCRTEWGDWFGCNNANPMYQFVVEDRYLRRNPRVRPPAVHVPTPVEPGTAPVFPASRTTARFNDFHTANRFTSACSVMLYRDDWFGPEFVNNVFLCEPVHNLVHREILYREGTRYRSRRPADESTSEFFASTDNWSRPTCVTTAPDGSLWITDMYRHVIEHPEWIPKDWQARLDLRAGQDKGRIYRVYPTAKGRRPWPKLTALTGPQLVNALDSPSGWQRDMVSQMLLWRKDLALAAELEKLVKNGARSETRLAALCVLDGLNAVRPEILEAALTDGEAGVRRNAIRIAETRHPSTIVSALGRLEVDADPFVRIQLAYSLGEITDPRAGAALARLFLAGDPTLRVPVLSSAGKHLQGLFDAVTSNPKADPALLALLLEQTDIDRQPQQLLGVLARLSSATPSQPESTAANWRGLLRLLVALCPNGEPIDRRLNDVIQANPALAKSMEQLRGQFTLAREWAITDSKPVSVRLLAVELLGRDTQARSQDLATLTKTLGPQNAPELQQAAISGLARMGGAEPVRVFLQEWKSFSPTSRIQALDALLSRREWLGDVVDAVEKGPIEVGDWDASRRQNILAVVTERERTRLAKRFDGAGQAPKRQAVIDQYLSQMRDRGHPDRGAVAFKRVCSACHKVGDIGQATGPDLLSLANRPTDYLVTAVLDPNRAVESRYLSYLAETADGRVFTGMLVQESSNHLELTGVDGKRVTLLRSDLVALKSSGKSHMPEGLEKDLKPTELSDILAFLLTNGPPAKKFAGNDPSVIRPDNAGVLALTAKTCAIYGSTLVFEAPFQNLGYWSSADDQAIWTVETKQAGRYQVVLDFACHDGAAGDPFVLQVGEQRLTLPTPGTGEWENYQTKTIGEIHLPAGESKIIARPDGKPRTALIDLRAIYLKPR